MKENIFLIGFSGTGKTSTGLALSKLLGYEFIDTDLQIEADTGRSVPEIFATEGEAAFRELERAALERICESNTQVVSTGGGIVLLKENRTAMTANGYVFGLEAQPETIYVRLLLDSATRPEAAARPLLAGDDQFERITNLKAQRQTLYAGADWTLHTDFLSPDEVAQEIVRALDFVRRRSDKGRGGPGSPASPGSPHAARTLATPFHRGGSIGSIASVEETTAPDLAGWGESLTVRTSAGSYPVLFGEALLGKVGPILREAWPESAGRRALIVTDSEVGPRYGATVSESLARAGYRPLLQIIPAGEGSKSLEQAAALYDWLAGVGAERRDLVLALGGGVVGDLAGFVAATWLRGLPFVQLPTTLLAMVDSSVGGKTGVNHPAGKNLIGAFYPPQAVLADVLTLTGLPERVRQSGWAEVVKHAIIPGIGDEGTALARFERLEGSVPALNAGDMAVTAAILRESVAVKAGVVEQDERERGVRITLNYGHTFAHALEAATGYGTLLHGEAVAIGMHGAARLAERLGLCPAQFVTRQHDLLHAFGLPTSAAQLQIQADRAALLAAMSLDKKVEGGSVRWILPHGIGRLEIRRNVPAEAVQAVAEELLA